MLVQLCHTSLLILTIEYQLGAPWAPQTLPGIWTHCKSRLELRLLRKRPNIQDNITKNMTMPICNYAFTTNELLMILCRLRAPQARLKHWIWPIYKGHVIKTQKVQFLITKVYLFNYVYKSLLILTGAPQSPPGYLDALWKLSQMASFQEACEKKKRDREKHDHVNWQ